MRDIKSLQTKSSVKSFKINFTFIKVRFIMLFLTLLKGGFMKTEVTMQRELFGEVISQKHKSEFFSATDLVRAGNKWRATNGLSLFNMNDWFNQKGTKEFIAELEAMKGVVKISGRGRGNHTWVHPLLFIDMALAISPKLKIEVYEWLYDSLLKNRDDSGDSFKLMSGALFVHESDKSEFTKNIKKLSFKIRQIVGVKDWQTATQDQLALRDKIHTNIALLANVLRDNNRAIIYGIKEAIKP